MSLIARGVSWVQDALPLVALLLVLVAALVPAGRTVSEATIVILITAMPDKPVMWLLKRVHSSRRVFIGGVLLAIGLGVTFAFFVSRLGPAAGLIAAVLYLFFTVVTGGIFRAILAGSLARSWHLEHEERIKEKGPEAVEWLQTMIRWSTARLLAFTAGFALWLAGWIVLLSGSRLGILYLCVAAVGLYATARMGFFISAAVIGVVVLKWWTDRRKRQAIARYGSLYDEAYTAVFEELVRIDPFQRQYSHRGRGTDYQKKYDKNVIDVLHAALKWRRTSVDELRYAIWEALSKDPYGNHWDDVGSEERYQAVAERLWAVLHAPNQPVS